MGEKGSLLYVKEGEALFVAVPIHPQFSLSFFTLYRMGRVRPLAATSTLLLGGVRATIERGLGTPWISKPSDEGCGIRAAASQGADSFPCN